MFAIERRRRIISMLEEKSSVMVLELSKTFDVTEETVRRDLDELEKQGILKRTHGGAVALENTNNELPLKIREVTNIEGKQSIGIRAAQFIEDGDAISLDSSTTALQVARQIKSKKRITVITNSMNIVYELANVKDFTVISTGGNLRPISMGFVGPLAENSVKNYNVDKALVSCKGVHMEREFTESNEAEARVKKAMVESADKVFMLLDSTKFNKVSFINMLKIEQAHVLFTDKKLPDEWEQLIAGKNVKLVYC